MNRITIDGIEYNLVPVPPEPKFKLHDIVRHYGSDSVNYEITRISDDRYYFNDGPDYLQFSGQDAYSLVGFVEQKTILLTKDSYGHN